MIGERWLGHAPRIVEHRRCHSASAKNMSNIKRRKMQRFGLLRVRLDGLLDGKGMVSKPSQRLPFRRDLGALWLQKEDGRRLARDGNEEIRSARALVPAPQLQRVRQSQLNSHRSMRKGFKNLIKYHAVFAWLQNHRFPTVAFDKPTWWDSKGSKGGLRRVYEKGSQGEGPMQEQGTERKRMPHLVGQMRSDGGRGWWLGRTTHNR